MLNSPWLDVAIGVVFVWFLLSIVVSAVNELINRVFAVRAKNLWMAFNQMLDGKYALKPAWKQLFVIIGNRGRPHDPTRQNRKKHTVYERLYSTHAIQALENHKNPDRKTKIHNIPRTVFSQALIELGVREAKSPDEKTVGEYLAGLPTPLGPQLQVIWAEAGDDLGRFRIGVETWFESQMARLSALYRAQVRWAMLAIGVLVAVAGFGFGARTDSLGLVSDLQRDESLRRGLSDLAVKVTNDDLTAIAAKGCPPTTTEASGDDEDSPAEEAPQYVCVARGLATYQGINLVFDDQGITPGAPDRSFGDVWKDFWSNFANLFTSWRSVLGVSITAAGLSFGASFWWNVLRRLVGLRQNGQTAASA